jgi:hypothetical protein
MLLRKRWHHTQHQKEQEYLFHSKEVKICPENLEYKSTDCRNISNVDFRCDENLPQNFSGSKKAAAAVKAIFALFF